MKTIRVSSLPDHNDCGLRGAVRSFPQKFKDEGYTIRELSKGIGASVGTGVHSGVKYTLEKKKDTGFPAGIEETTDKSISAFDEDIIDGVEFDSKSPNVDTAHKQVIRITRAYKTFIEPKVKPIHLEEEFQAKHRDYLITGHPDQVTENSIRDVKTGNSYMSYFVQGGGYGLVHKANKGIPKLNFIIDWLRRVSIKKEYPRPMSIKFDMRQAENSAA